MSQDILQFKFLNSTFSSQFWFTLYKRKLEDWKLDDSTCNISAVVDTDCSRVEFDENSFSEADRIVNSQSNKIVYGILRNTNTIQEFKDFEKLKFQKEITREIFNRIHSDEFLKDPNVLNYFGLLTFADLKKYRFFYWFLIPALMPKEAYTVNRKILELTENQIIEIQKVKEYSIIQVKENIIEEDVLENYEKYDFEKCFIVLQGDQVLDWTVRNFLYAIKVKFGILKVRIILKKSLAEFLEILLPGKSSKDLPESVGWERNNNGKMGPKMVDLSGFMDPFKLAETAVDLNLKLIKWRAMPVIPLDKISSVKCCLFGAGTLGCYTARALMAWGVRNITFVDSGKVSFSNPVRQPLFKFKDCLDGGVNKAMAAAEELKSIFPGMNAKGHGI